MIEGLLQRLRDDTAGNTLAICAAAIIPLTAVIGSGLDLSVAYMTRAKLQNACDAGVLAGRQFMQGRTFNDAVRAEARRFFDFNFPEGTSGTTVREFTIEQDESDETQLIGTAHTVVPTSLMRIFGYEQIPLSVSCDATRDMGNNDVVLVLDVTGSMREGVPGGGTKIQHLRTGAMGLYRALDDDDGSVTRYGIVPYSIGVNVARSLMNKDILREQPYLDCSWWGCGTKWVHINQSSWNVGRGGGDVGGNTQRFRVSGQGCIEERPSIGNSLNLFRIENTVTRADIDTQAGNAGNQPELQFGRYDPGVQEGFSGAPVCPAEATTLQTYDSEQAFQNAINAATAVVDGNTYHDIGMLWGTRFISRTGFFAADNPAEIDGVPVNEHIVFMTDGEMVTNGAGYTAYGVQNRQQRVQGSGSVQNRHISRFLSTCDVARSMGITVWVIALGNIPQSAIEVIEPCASTPDLFFRTDGSDLEQVFERIGQGIGNLRLTR